MKPRVSKASPPCRVKTFPFMEAPAKTSKPTAKKTTSARPHMHCKAWPRPGKSHPARPKARARESLEERVSLMEGADCAPSFAGFCDGSSMSLRIENSTQAAQESPAEPRP